MLTTGFVNQKRLCVTVMFIQKLRCFHFFHCCDFNSAVFVLELLDEKAITCSLQNFPVSLSWRIDVGNGVFATSWILHRNLVD